MQRIIWLFVIAIMICNCGGETASTEQEKLSKAAEEPPKAEEKTSEAPTTSEATVLNPNLATAEELAATLKVEVERVEKLMANRPFLDMKDFHAILSDIMDEEALTSVMATCFVPMNLNTTPEEDFMLIPGVGKKMAHEFEEYRPYKKIAQFRREMGKYVDEAEIARYEKYVFVPVELNTATEEEILALPGIGKKMAHEFEEYRPYKNIDQFRREIGKYVDDKELARLERLVYLDKVQ